MRITNRTILANFTFRTRLIKNSTLSYLLVKLMLLRKYYLGAIAFRSNDKSRIKEQATKRRPTQSRNNLSTMPWTLSSPPRE